MSETKEKKQSVIEEALLEAADIQTMAEDNAKELLATQLKPEIDRIVKESISTESVEEETKMEESQEQPVVAEESVEESTEKNVNEESVEESTKNIDEEETVNEDNDLELGDDDLDDGDVEQIDLTGESDEDVVKVFKKMNSEDQVEVTKDGDSITLKDGDNEYLVKLNESEVSEKLNKDGSLHEECSDDEVIYEIEINEDELEESESVEESSEVTEETVDEGESIDEEESIEETISVTHAEGRNQTSQSDNFAKNSGHHRSGDSRYKNLYQESVVKLKNVSSENTELKSLNEQYKSALKDLRGKLDNIALFNTNLAHVNRLMTEQTTTKEEKVNIIQNFDKVKTIKESKTLYKTITDKLNKETIKESVEKKISKTSDSSTSKKINESKVYVDPQIDRMKNLMNYSF